MCFRSPGIGLLCFGRHSGRVDPDAAAVQRLPVIAFDLVAARTHARLWAQLAARGVTIGAHDLLIAATAIARGLDVVTRDERSFPRIQGLSLIRW